MRRKIRLKKAIKSRRIKRYIIVYIFIFIFVIIVLMYLGNIINEKAMKYAEIEATKISKLIVNNAVSDTMNSNLHNNELFDIIKNNEGDIQTVSFNTYAVNKILSEITNNIINMFSELENGDYKFLKIPNNLLTNTQLVNSKEGIVMEFPIGIITNNVFLNNLGPKIPVRLSLNGELESSVSTKVENYGINNALINVYVNIKVSEQVILPLSTKKITISNDIPISLKMIQGNVPNYYLNGINTNSGMLNIPLP